MRKIRDLRKMQSGVKNEVKDNVRGRRESKVKVKIKKETT